MRLIGHWHTRDKPPTGSSGKLLAQRLKQAYGDLEPAEIAAFAGVLVLLIVLSVMPQGLLDPGVQEVARIVMEMK